MKDIASKTEGFSKKLPKKRGGKRVKRSVDKLWIKKGLWKEKIPKRNVQRERGKRGESCRQNFPHCGKRGNGNSTNG